MESGTSLAGAARGGNGHGNMKALPCAASRVRLYPVPSRGEVTQGLLNYNNLFFDSEAKAVANDAGRESIETHASLGGADLRSLY